MLLAVQDLTTESGGSQFLVVNALGKVGCRQVGCLDLLWSCASHNVTCNAACCPGSDHRIRWQPVPCSQRTWKSRVPAGRLSGFALVLCLTQRDVQCCLLSRI